MLKELEIFGFKSFADKIKLIFPRPNEENFGITAIVGPNGSGKSNIVEAIQWVLGEQGHKTLRSHNSQDLIFSGSPLRARADYAEVGITLENKTNKDIWPLVEIKRRLWYNGDSDYILNKNKVRLADIEDTLFKLNFGKYNYSIIGQGEIIRLLEMTPAGKKEFFNEATGVKPYLKKIENSQKKIEMAKENLAKVEVALKEISPQLSYLSRQVQKLAKKQELKRELFQLEKDFYQIEAKKINQEISENETENPDLLNKIEKLKKSIEENEKKIQTLSSSNLSSRWQELQKEYQDKEAKKNQYSREIIALEFEIKSLKNIPKNEEIVLTVKNELLFQELKTIEQKMNSVLADISSSVNPSSFKNQIKELITSVNKILSYFKKQEPDKTFQEKSQNLLQTKKEFEERLEKISKEAKDIFLKLSSLGEEEDKFRQSFAIFEQENQKLRKELEIKENILQENKINLARLQEKRENLYKEIEKELGKDNLEKIINNSLGPAVESPIDDKEEKIAKIKRELLIIGEIDPEVEKEYPKISSRHNFLKQESDDLIKSIKSLNKIIDELKEQTKKQFNKQFNEINKKFDEYFKRLFDGGYTKLIPIKLKNEENPSKDELKEVEGIEIEACPPGKKIKSVKTLSGGEKTLTSLALISAILSLNKPPFAIYDEVDAALDEENSLRFAEILKEINKDSQLIIITHNRQTMQAADTLYGITMGRDGVSKIISVKLDEN